MIIMIIILLLLIIMTECNDKWNDINDNENMMNVMILINEISNENIIINDNNRK